MLWFFRYFGWHLLLLIWSTWISPTPNELLLNEPEPLVEIPSLGAVRGSVKLSENGRLFYAYRGLPYAEPPIGSLRFKDPVPVLPWTGLVFDASKEGPVCVQYFSFLHFSYGVEDCLRLNVYTPTRTKDLLPVMVWIHGGGFTLGSGNGETEIYGPQYLMDRDIVLVTINYRLGPLGFLSTEDAEAPGNYGLLDQSLALRWIKEHINNFGGDSNSITIFGESAGGASVGFQMLSPYSKGLFNRAIAESGAPTAPWGFQSTKGTAAGYAKELAVGMGCPIDSSAAIIECLRTKKAIDIANFKKKISLSLCHELFPNPFTPRIDVERENPFLPDHPLVLVKSGRFNSVPFISGVNQNEGVIFSMSLFMKNGRPVESFQADPIKNFQMMLNMEKTPDGEKIAREFFNYYLDSEIPYIAQHKQFEKFMSDIGFFLPFDQSTKAISNRSEHPVFTYYYNHQGFMSIPRMIGFSPHIDFGVGHADEMFLLFKTKLTPTMSLEDKQISSTLIDLWTSFAKNGTPSSQFIENEWLPYEPDHQQYLLIGDDSTPKMVQGEMPFTERLKVVKKMLNVVDPL